MVVVTKRVDHLPAYEEVDGVPVHVGLVRPVRERRWRSGTCFRLRSLRY